MYHSRLGSSTEYIRQDGHCFTPKLLSPLGELAMRTRIVRGFFQGTVVNPPGRPGNCPEGADLS